MGGRIFIDSRPEIAEGAFDVFERNHVGGVVRSKSLRMDTGNKANETGKTDSSQLHPESWLNSFNLNYLGPKGDSWLCFWGAARYGVE